MQKLSQSLIPNSDIPYRILCSLPLHRPVACRCLSFSQRFGLFEAGDKRVIRDSLQSGSDAEV